MVPLASCDQPTPFFLLLVKSIARAQFMTEILLSRRASERNEAAAAGS